MDHPSLRSQVLDTIISSIRKEIAILRGHENPLRPPSAETGRASSRVMLASLTPQQAVDRGLPKPSECDFVIVILWGRFGTPLPDSVRKPSGERHLSGTEWEYEDAISAKRRPEILIYRRTEKVLLDADDPEHQSKLEQRKRVNEFFERFRSPDCSYKGGVNTHFLIEKLTRSFHSPSPNGVSGKLLT